jgi:hypothetical protein
VLFVDRSAGSQTVPGSLRDAGFRVELHDDHFPVETADHVWINEVGRRGWYVVTLDKRIYYSPISKAAVERNRVGVFVFRLKSPSSEVLLETTNRAVLRIREFIRKTERPFFAKIYHDGSIKHWVSKKQQKP